MNSLKSFSKISSRISVAGQISHDDISAAAADGIKTIICNRPHAESEDQPETTLLAAAAAAAGIEFLHIPVVSGAITETNVDDFAKAYETAAGPILAYCRSGKRSTILWALAVATSQDIEDILATTADAGFDLSPLRPMLEARAAQPQESPLE